MDPAPQQPNIHAVTLILAGMRGPLLTLGAGIGIAMAATATLLLPRVGKDARLPAEHSICTLDLPSRHHIRDARFSAGFKGLKEFCMGLTFRFPDGTTTAIRY